MNPPCPHCKKTVYPTEKFNCLDKIWHKGCFKCTECGLKLTMNTYKGFNKMPYCNAHYPKLKATAVAQTAEQSRLQKISNQQSQVLYHKDFNEAKGAKISVTDDPALKTQKQASQHQSLAAYHGLAQKKANQEMRRPAQEDQPEPDGIPPPLFVTNYSIQDASEELSIPAGQAPPQSRKIGSIHDYNIEDEQHGFSQQQQQQPQQPAGGSYRPPPPEPAQPRGPVFRAMYDYAAADTDEVSFAEGDIIINTEPIDEGWMTGTVERTGETGYGGGQGGGGGYGGPPPGGYGGPPPGGYGAPPPAQPAYSYEPEPEPEPVPPAPQPDYDPEPAAQNEQEYQPEDGGGGSGDEKMFIAAYDYSAADDDEVTFSEGDQFSGVIIDEGWLEGTVLSTGQRGMAPRNYFEEV